MTGPAPDRRAGASAPPRLKWHKLRWQAGDPPFQRHNLAAALAAGAPCEVDLRFTADHHALCIHDAVLDHETTGTGPVEAAHRADIERLRQRGNRGEVLDTAPLFLDEVVAAVSPDTGPGQVQLDVKTPVGRIHPEALRRFGLLLGPLAPAFVASGYEPALIERLTGAAPGLRAGFDPLALYRQPARLSRSELEALGRRTRAAVPTATVWYLEARLVLAALDRRFDLVSALTRGNGPDPPTSVVDAWTVDPDQPGVAGVVSRLVAAGVGQITTNAPSALAALLPPKSR